MPNRVFIGLGTNLGDRAANYREAIDRIGKLPDTRVLRQSSIYETEPVGDVKGAFLNGAIEVETELPPDVLMRKLLSIERVMGRKRVKGRKAASRGKYPSVAAGKAIRFGTFERTGARTDSSQNQQVGLGNASRAQVTLSRHSDARRPTAPFSSGTPLRLPLATHCCACHPVRWTEALRNPNPLSRCRATSSRICIAVSYPTR
jgi:2-amino-4-hydroxy-6-hydroxymethyldihydropteridine diphosphokinase